ncbi:MAG: cold shock domain-containing protein [Candidatus Thermoplasmatota archaeon]|nr:cold shock domain-containing protein [Candidatus Thermoplasmatota archaeon]
MEGTVKRWMLSYGFIGAEGMGRDIFVHQSDVKSNTPLKEGQKVKFDVKDEPKGPKAINVEVIG